MGLLTIKNLHVSKKTFIPQGMLRKTERSKNFPEKSL